MRRLTPIRKKTLLHRIKYAHWHTSFRLIPTSMTLNDLERVIAPILRFFQPAANFRGELAFFRRGAWTAEARGQGVIWPPHYQVWGQRIHLTPTYNVYKACLLQHLGHYAPSTPFTASNRPTAYAHKIETFVS